MQCNTKSEQILNYEIMMEELERWFKMNSLLCVSILLTLFLSLELTSSADTNGKFKTT